MMGYVALFVFYVMVAILTLDMSQYLDWGGSAEADPAEARPAPRRASTPLVSAFGRAMRSKRLRAVR
ncbi:MAG: hypothetical protein EB084_11530 [Proteobacteria bacterium]|nr:hypothetical protein [Pseudomonadota bacterium]